MARVLDEIVYHLGQEIVSKFSLEEPQAVNLPHQVKDYDEGKAVQEFRLIKIVWYLDITISVLTYKTIMILKCIIAFP